jgi:Uma2 family endonuclease
MSSQPDAYITPEEYLEIERRADHKSEYYRGEMFAMAGGTLKHGLIVGNVLGELRQQLKGKPCVAFPGDMRLRVTPIGLYTYPDVMVVCGEVQFADQRSDAVLNPLLIIEVLSIRRRTTTAGRNSSTIADCHH